MSESDALAIFDLHDPQKKRSLPKSEIAFVLRSAGRMLTDAQMKDLLAPYGKDVSRSEFAELLRKVPDGPNARDLLVAFQSFDTKETGLLSRSEIVSILTTMNEKIPTLDAERLVAGAKFQSDDTIAIQALVDHLVQSHRTLKVTVSETKAVLASAHAVA